MIKMNLECPSCHSDDCWMPSTEYYQCSNCSYVWQKDFSVLDTIDFEEQRENQERHWNMVD